LSVDPRISFWVGIAVTIAVGIGGGAVSFSHVIPDAWMPTVQGISNIIGFAGTAVLTALHGISSDKAGPLS
jgi:hypothetical protein